jgi:electron transport complex protein RnfB
LTLLSGGSAGYFRMFNSLIVLGLLAGLCGLALGFVAARFRVQGNPVVEKIDAVLPQTQCGQCDYPGCRPYAEAIAVGNADINRCPPGGDGTIRALARLLGRDPKPLDPQFGEEQPKAVARIDEPQCIGCALCLEVCPVDAILGASRQMHTVIVGECTGCALCVEPCPVDCIHMVPLLEDIDSWKCPDPVLTAKELK